MKRRLAYSPYLPIIAAVILRIIHLLSIAGSPVVKIPVIDSAYYHETAIRIAEGTGGGEGVFFMSPLYPYFLSVFYGIFGESAIIAVIVQSAMSWVTIYLIWSMTCGIAGEKAGVIAAWTAAIFPVWIYYDGMILTASLILFLNTLTLWIIFKWLSQREKLNPAVNYMLVISAGIITGLSALARPNILLFLILFCVWLLFRKDYKFSVLLIAGTALAVIPVTVRNYAKSGEFALTTASGGMNFYVGNSEFSTGLYVEPDFLRSSEPEFEFSDYKIEAESRTGKSLNYTENSRFWYKSGLQFITANPGRALNLWWNKFFYFWNNLEAPDNLSFYLVKRYSPVLRYIPLGFGLLAALGCAGLLFVMRGEFKMVIQMYLGSLILTCMIYFTSSEFRFPAVPVLAMGAGILIAGLSDNRSDFKTMWKPLFFVIGALYFTHFQTNIGQFLKSPRMDYFNLASVCMKNGEYNSAVQYFGESLKDDPGFFEGHMGMGTALMELGKYEAAAREFNAAGYKIAADSLKNEHTRQKVGG